MKYTVGDKVLVKAEVISINTDDKYPVRVLFEDETEEIFKEDDLMLDMTSVDTIPQEEVMKSAYNQGLNDAWELAKKIFAPPECGGLLVNEVIEIFGCDYHEVAKEFTPQEALAKLKAYEEAQEIKVGDVVLINPIEEDNYKGVVLDIYQDLLANVFDENGCVVEYRLDDLKKTGKHIDIQSILEQIGE